MSGCRAHFGTCDQILLSVRRFLSESCCLVSVGRPLWREVGSVNWKKNHSPNRVSNPRPSGFQHGTWTTTLPRTSKNTFSLLFTFSVFLDSSIDLLFAVCFAGVTLRPQTWRQYIPRNVGKLLQVYFVSHSWTWLREFHIQHNYLLFAKWYVHVHTALLMVGIP
jgi:hypothetical protein